MARKWGSYVYLAPKPIFLTTAPCWSFCLKGWEQNAWWKDLVAQDGGQTCRALNVGLRSLDLVPKAMGSYGGFLRRVVTWPVLTTWSILKMDRHCLAVPQGLCSRLTSIPQPRQPIQMARDPSSGCCSL